MVTLALPSRLGASFLALLPLLAACKGKSAAPPAPTPTVGVLAVAPQQVPAVFELIARAGDVAAGEMWEVFNMGCGFCAIVAADRADETASLLGRHHPGAAVIGRVTDHAGRVELPAFGLTFT